MDGTLEVLANDVELLADGSVGRRLHGRFAVGIRAEPFQSRAHDGRRRLDLKPGDNYATFVSSTNNVNVRGGRAQRRRGVPDQRRHLGRHHGGRGRRHLDHRPWQAGLRFQHGLGVRRERTGVLGLSNGTINLLPATPEMAQGPGYINIGPAAALARARPPRWPPKAPCWSPPTAPSRWPTMRAMVRATCCWRCPR
ncbi:hypothetical protein WJ968_04450 [Achromobacter xylosoxidans]